MSWPQKEAITQGIMDMLRVNMGLNSGEVLLVVTDTPRSEDWQNENLAKLRAMSERAAVARLAAEVGSEGYPECSVAYWPFPATGRHGAELDEATAARMQEADVVVAITTYSLSHTNAREAATAAGGRVASMPEFEAHMLEPGGPMAADYVQIAADCQVFADLLTAAKEAVVRAPHGTDIRFSLEGRPGHADDGLYGTEPGIWGNLPAGETYAIPLEGTAEGIIVFDLAFIDWGYLLREPLHCTVKEGRVVDISGYSEEVERLREMAARDENADNIAELGIGTSHIIPSPMRGIRRDAARIGTAHIAIGRNDDIGGATWSRVHTDGLMSRVTIELDDKCLLRDGELLI